MSANDDALGRISQQQFNRYKAKFAPLVRDLDQEAQKDKSATMRGRGAADVMQGLSGAPGVRSTGQPKAIEQMGTRALGSGLTQGSNMADQRQRDLTKGVMQAATGAGQSAIQGLGEAESIATDRMIHKLKMDVARKDRHMDLAGSVIGAGASAMGGMSFGGGTNTQHGTFERTAYNHRVGKGGF